MRRSTQTTALAVAALLLATGCSRCATPKAAPPASRWVPASAAGLLLIPDLGEASRQAGALYGALSALPGAEDLVTLRTGMGAQLGIDLLDPASLESVGLDAKRGVAAAELAVAGGEGPGAPLLVLPVGDAAKLEAFVARIARDRLGATEKGQENANGQAIGVWRRSAGGPALVATIVAEGSLLVSVGPGGPAALRTVLALDRAVSMEQSPPWKRGQAVLGAGLPALFFVSRDAPALAGSPFADGLAGGLSASAGGLKVVTAGLLGLKEGQLRPLAGPGPGRQHPSPLDPATVLAVRLAFDQVAGIKLLADTTGATPPPQALALAEQLEPGIDLGLGIPPKAELASAFGPSGRPDPLRVLRGELLAQVKDADKAAAVLDSLAREVRAVGTNRRWTLPGTGADVEVAWALVGKTLALTAGPKGGLDPLLARAAGKAKGFEATSPSAAAALAGGLGGAVLDAANLVKAVQALPPEAFGSGPDAVVLRSMAEKITSPSNRAGTVSLRADLPEGAMRLALEFELGPPPKKP